MTEEPGAEGVAERCREQDLTASCLRGRGGNLPSPSTRGVSEEEGAAR